jgi:hypothetical protein
MKIYGGTGCIAPPFFTSALDGSDWSASRPGHFTAWDFAPGTDWIRGWVSLRASLNPMEKMIIFPLPGIEH